LLSGLLGLAALGGCKQQIFLEPADYEGAKQNLVLAKLESEPYETITPSPVQQGTTPATILDPTRPPRYISLKEAIAIALEQGNTGFPVTSGFATPGNMNEALPNFTGNGATGTDKINAFALDPAIAGAEIERAVSKFDARWITSMTWNKVDNPTLTLQQSFSNGDTANFNSTLAKPLPTGGLAGITFSTQYLKLANPPSNPQFVTLGVSYTPQLLFTFEQPLLQGFGVEINQLLPNHPGSQLIPGLRPSGGQGSAGILVTRIRRDQQQAQFNAYVNQMLLNVEGAYWKLYSAYYALAAQEEGMKQSLSGYQYFQARVKGGVTRQQQAFQTQAQYHLFQTQVLSARGDVLQAERQLRGMLGMRSDDGTRLVPIDEPTLVAFRPDYYELANEAMRFRPELTIARQELKARQMDLVLQRNLRRPDLRFLSNYSIQGLGASLDGRNTPLSQNINALQSFGSNQFNNWQLGLRLDMPLGFRDANALVRQAELNLRKTYFALTDAERKTLEFLTQQYRQVIQSHEIIQTRRSQREALQKYIELNQTLLKIGQTGPTAEAAEGFVANLIQVQRDLAAATASEFQAVADYNIALASLEYAKGTSQAYNNVTISEGPLPPQVAKKATDHFRARDVALKLREHPAALPLPPLSQWQPMKNILGPAGTFPPPPGGFPIPPAPGSPSIPLVSAPTGQPATPWNPNRTGGEFQPDTAAAKATLPPPPAPPATATTPQPVTLPTTPAQPIMTAPTTEPAPPAGATFTPIGRLTLPKRNMGGPPAEPTDAPLPSPKPATTDGSGLPILAPAPPR
jgi:outer membrane protein TolC